MYIVHVHETKCLLEVHVHVVNMSTTCCLLYFQSPVKKDVKKLWCDKEDLQYDVQLKVSTQYTVFDL